MYCLDRTLGIFEGALLAAPTRYHYLVGKIIMDALEELHNATGASEVVAFYSADLSAPELQRLVALRREFGGLTMVLKDELLPRAAVIADAVANVGDLYGSLAAEEFSLSVPDIAEVLDRYKTQQRIQCTHGVYRKARQLSVPVPTGLAELARLCLYNGTCRCIAGLGSTCVYWILDTMWYPALPARLPPAPVG